VPVVVNVPADCDVPWLVMPTNETPYWPAGSGCPLSLSPSNATAPVLPLTGMLRTGLPDASVI
jgi:hypothetical protein